MLKLPPYVHDSHMVYKSLPFQPSYIEEKKKMLILKWEREESLHLVKGVRYWQK